MFNKSPLQDAPEVSKKQKWVYGSLIGILLCSAGFGFYVRHEIISDTDRQNSQLVNLTNKDTSLVQQQTQTKYVVTGQGQLDDNAQKTIAAIKSAITPMVDFTNGTQYANAVKNAQHLITDKSFFDPNSGFTLTQTDSTGGNVIDNLGLKSQLKNIDVYEVAPNQYYVIVNHYYYKRNVDLNYLNSLQVTSSQIFMNGNVNGIYSAKPVAGITSPS